MKYKNSLDIKIINYLLKNEKESRNKLKEAVKEKSDDVFDYHTTKLINDGTISRSPLKRIQGKKTYYSLTLNGKKQYGLKLISVGEENHIYQKIYQELFLYEFNKSSVFIYTEKDLMDFLKESNISNVLEWNRVQTREDNDWWKIIYPSISTKNYKSTDESFMFDFSSKQKNKQFISKFWSNEGDNQFILCELNFIAPPIEILDHLIWISKTEHWQINRNGIHLKYGTTFIIDLPGLDYQELINIIQCKYQMIKKEQIEYALKLLKDIELITILQIGNNKRIVINDEKLRRFIETIQDGIHFVEMNLLLNKWYFFEKPSNQEIERMKKLLGKDEAKSMFNTTTILRTKERKLVLKCKNIDGYVEQLKILSGLHKQSKITDDPSLTEKEKELYKHMTILGVIDEGYTSTLDDELEDYEINYIPNEKCKLDKEIKEEKLKLFDPSKKEFVKESIKNKRKKRRILNNYKKNINMYFKFRKTKWYNSYLDFEYKSQALKEEFKDIFDKYEYILKPVFEVFFPSLAILEPYAPPDYSIQISDISQSYFEKWKQDNNKTAIPEECYMELKNGKRIIDMEKFLEYQNKKDEDDI